MVACVLGAAILAGPGADARAASPAAPAQTVHYRYVTVDGVRLFYREAGARTKPTLVLLHGFPSSSPSFRELIPRLARRFHVVAPDYPGFGLSSTPPPTEFTYTFDRLATVIDSFLERLRLRRYALYMHDYGGPVGFRLAVAHPGRVTGLIIQNTVAHDETFRPAIGRLVGPFWENRTPETEAPVRGFFTAESTRSQYLGGARNPANVSPDAYLSDQAFLDRPGQAAIQLDLLYDYRTNPGRFAEWQRYLRRRQPPTLIEWGRGDVFFTVRGALAYRRELPRARVRLYDTGHFPLEEDVVPIARDILEHFRPRR